MSYPIDGTGSLHIGTCPCDRCTEDPPECPQCEQPLADKPYCQNSYCARRGMRPDEDMPLDSFDAQGIDTRADLAYSRTDFENPDPAGEKLWEDLPF